MSENAALGLGNAVARVSPDPLDRPRITRSTSDGLARILSDKLRSRSRTSIGRTHIRNPLARIPSRSLVHGHLPAPLRVHWTNFARFRPHSESPRPLSIGWTRIRKPDAASTISQPRYGRNQPPRNHIPTSTTPRPRSNRPCPVLSAIHLSVQPLLNHKKSAAKLPRYYCAIRIAAHLIITDFILCIPMCRQCHSAGLTTIKTSHLARQLLRTNDSSPASSLSSSRILSTSTLIALALSADESA